MVFHGVYWAIDDGNSYFDGLLIVPFGYVKAIEDGPVESSWVFPFKIVIFHSYDDQTLGIIG